MDTQFDNLNIDEIDPQVKYYCSSIQMSKGFTLCMKYAILGQYKNLKSIVSPSNIDTKNKVGWTALMLACRNSNKTSNNETVKLLLDNKANVNLRTASGLDAIDVVM